MRLLLLVALICGLFAAAAYAQIAGTNGGSSGSPIGPHFIKPPKDFGMGYAGGANASGGGGGGCTTGQLDFTQGCNTTFYVLGVT